MEHLYSHKNIKQDKNKKKQDKNVKVHSKIKASFLQTPKTQSLPKNKSFSYLESDRTKKKLYLENQNKKRWGLYHSRERLSRPICETKVKPRSKLLRTLDFGGFPQMINVEAKENLYHSKGSLLSQRRDGFFLETRKVSSSLIDKRGHALALSKSFVNLIMIDGKKSQAEKIFSQTLKKLAQSLQNHVERENRQKKEIIFFDRKSNAELFSLRRKYPLLIVSDKMEKKSVYHLLQKAIDNVKPTLQVRKVRIARSIYQVPFIMKKRRQERNAVRWIIESAKKRSRHSEVRFSESLASCVLEAFMAQGDAKEKRDQLHRTAEANRGYLRYRWW